MKKNNLFGKKILITQPIICGIGGSTVVTLELARYLRDIGADVTIYTCAYDFPARQYYEENSLKVYCADDNPQLHIKDFDYIWVNSQILPKSFLDDFTKPISDARFIFCHMSSADWVPDERPWIYGLEEKICSLKLFISEGTKNKNDGFFKRNIPYKFFRNPAPMEYSKLPPKTAKDFPKNILIVSNHPPKELLDAAEALSNKGVNILLLSSIHREHKLISPEVIDMADVVVTIGKTAQYCLVSGTPVYIYDHFGGDGYLNEKNYTYTKQYNFSGRFTRKKTSKAIQRELINGYKRALDFQANNLEIYREEFLIDGVVNDIFSNIRPTNIKPFSPEYLKSLDLSQELAINYFKAFARETRHIDDNKSYLDKISALEYEIDQIKKSKTYRVGKIIIMPLSVAKGAIRRIVER